MAAFSLSAMCKQCSTTLLKASVVESKLLFGWAVVGGNHEQPGATRVELVGAAGRDGGVMRCGDDGADGIDRGVMRRGGVRRCGGHSLSAPSFKVSGHRSRVYPRSAINFFFFKQKTAYEI